MATSAVRQRPRRRHSRGSPVIRCSGGREDSPVPRRPSLVTIPRGWGRIGLIGFGEPPTHIKLLSDLCVQRRGWLNSGEFEDAVAACNLQPGPARPSWRSSAGGGSAAVLERPCGSAAFIVPGLIVILALAVLFLSNSPP